MVHVKKGGPSGLVKVHGQVVCALDRIFWRFRKRAFQRLNKGLTQKSSRACPYDQTLVHFMKHTDRHKWRLENSNSVYVLSTSSLMHFSLKGVETHVSNAKKKMDPNGSKWKPLCDRRLLPTFQRTLTREPATTSRTTAWMNQVTPGKFIADGDKPKAVSS